jgi:hypothetical protein
MASIPVVKAHASRGFPLDADRRSGQAGTGGARDRTIRARICVNNPIRQCGAICVLVDQHMGQQARPGKAALNRS